MLMRIAVLASVVLAANAASIEGNTVEKKALTARGAGRVIAGAAALAQKLGTTGVIAVVDEGGNLMAVHRIDGTFSAGAEISVGKARTAAKFRKPTRVFEEIIGKGRTAMVAVEHFTPLQGGVPLMVDGEIVGGVGVSGAANAQQDEELAMAGAAALRAEQRVSYFESAKVDAAFARGAVLFDEGERYMVHASRREQPGMAEIHTEDADIVHVLDGEATLVTGGRAVGSRMTAAGEWRGTSIEGGEERMLRKGDVVIVPAGVPHWFKKTTTPFLYYVVKSR
jgi:glc operon protein GlcG